MIPNLFWKAKIPDDIPKSMQKIVDDLKKSKNREECVKKAYDIMSKRYTGSRIYEKFFDLFITDISKIWNNKGGSHCTNLNFLLRTLLVKSGFFKDDGIKLRLTFVYIISIHQYLKIKLSDNESIDIDPWGTSHGIRFGQYANTLALMKS